MKPVELVCSSYGPNTNTNEEMSFKLEMHIGPCGHWMNMSAKLVRHSRIRHEMETMIHVPDLLATFPDPKTS
jgi:hypothetical protein